MPSKLKVAVAGTGNVARYLFEELSKYGHTVVVLTRRTKDSIKDHEQRETDYSVPSLVSVLQDVDALVSTVSDYINPSAATQSHLAMIEACKQSPKCKAFVPSEWTGNIEEYPEQPIVLAENAAIVHGKLKQEAAAAGIKWTIICNAWFAEYVVPASQRYLPDMGDIWAMDHEKKVFTIYGSGTQLTNLTPVRDVAKAVAVLLASDEEWEEYTYVSGEQLSWNDIFAIIKKRDPEWTSRKKTLADSVKQIVDNESPESAFVGYFELQVYANSLALPPEKVQRHREKYFQGVHFRTVEEVLDDATARPGEVI